MNGVPSTVSRSAPNPALGAGSTHAQAEPIQVGKARLSIQGEAFRLAIDSSEGRGQPVISVRREEAPLRQLAHKWALGTRCHTPCKLNAPKKGAISHAFDRNQPGTAAQEHMQIHCELHVSTETESRSETSLVSERHRCTTQATSPVTVQWAGAGEHTPVIASRGAIT